MKFRFVEAKLRFVKTIFRFPETKFRFVEAKLRSKDTFNRHEISLRNSLPRNFVSIHHLACEISSTLEQKKHRNFAAFSSETESSQFDCRNSRNFADLGKFSLHFFCMIDVDCSRQKPFICEKN